MARGSPGKECGQRVTWGRDRIAMYKTFFGLHENPFKDNPDPRFLYRTSQIQEAMDKLTCGIQDRKGFILLTGEAGTGKTTLINYLLNWLRDRKTPTAFIFNSHLSANHLFDFILADFGIPIDFRLKSNMLMGLNTWLIERFRAGETPVLFVDEAQGLSLELLEEIRLLLNLETASEKLLQIVLAGQPEIENKLKRPELRQLRQRITLRCNTAPLTLEETHGYIIERLRIGGAVGDTIFASDAMDATHFYSQGIPRVINLLCEHALTNAHVEQFRPVPARMVEEAAHEFLLDEDSQVATHSNSGDLVSTYLTDMQLIYANGRPRPFVVQEARLREPSHVVSSAEVAAFIAIEEPALTAGNNTAATIRECEAIPVSMENSKASIFLKDLITASTGPEVKQKESALNLSSLGRIPGSMAPLSTETKRNLAAVSPIPSFHPMPQSGGDEPSSTAKGSQMSAPENCALTLDTMNRIPNSSRRTPAHALLLLWKSWSPRWGTRFLPAISLAAWSRASAAVLRSMGQPIYPAQVLQRWAFEFKRDWIAMINAIAFPQMKKSSTRWPRQSVSSKSMVSSKNRPV
jgi:general secretion pathway protein A